jgi:hypothetical protein
MATPPSYTPFQTLLVNALNAAGVSLPVYQSIIDQFDPGTPIDELYTSALTNAAFIPGETAVFYSGNVAIPGTNMTVPALTLAQSLPDDQFYTAGQTPLNAALLSANSQALQMLANSGVLTPVQQSTVTAALQSAADVALSQHFSVEAGTNAVGFIQSGDSPDSLFQTEEVPYLTNLTQFNGVATDTQESLDLIALSQASTQALLQVIPPTSDPSTASGSVIQAFLQGAALDTIFSSPQYVTQNVLNGNITYSIANAEILGSPFQPSLVDPTQPNIFAPGGTTITVTGPLGIPVGTLTFDPEGQSGIGSISYSVLTPVPGLVPVPNFPDATITGSQFLASQPITVNNAAGTVSGSINEITIKGVDEDGPFQGTIVTPVAPITIGPGGVTTGPTGQYPLNIEPDGTLDITVDSSGTQVTWAPDGSGTVLGPDGSTLLTLPPGSITGTMQTSDNSFALTLAPNSSGVPGTLSIDGETGNLQLATDGLTESAFPIDLHYYARVLWRYVNRNGRFDIYADVSDRIACCQRHIRSE